MVPVLVAKGSENGLEPYFIWLRPPQQASEEVAKRGGNLL